MVLFGPSETISGPREHTECDSDLLGADSWINVTANQQHEVWIPQGGLSGYSDSLIT